MGIYGSVATMSLPDLLQWVADARKHGGVRLRRGNASTQIYCRDGRVVACSSNDPPKLMGQFLLYRGVITEDQLRNAMAEQENTGRRLPEILVEQGAVDADVLEREVALKAQETLLGLFEWEDAAFEFNDGESPDRHAMPVALDIREVLLEGVTRIDEQAELRSVFPDSQVIVAHTLKLPPVTLQDDFPSRQVFRAVDGRRSLREIALHVHGTEFLVGRCLLQLHRAGLVEPSGSRAGGGTPSVPESASEAPAVVDLAAAQRLISNGEHEAALEMLGAAYHANPGDIGVKRLISEAEAALVAQIEREGLSPAKVPVPLKGPNGGSEISAEEDFLLNLCDGTWDVRSLSWVAPMCTTEVLTTLKHMVERGLVELREPSPA